jgi:hypothetical protein
MHLTRHPSPRNDGHRGRERQDSSPVFPRRDRNRHRGRQGSCLIFYSMQTGKKAGSRDCHTAKESEEILREPQISSSPLLHSHIMDSRPDSFRPLVSNVYNSNLISLVRRTLLCARVSWSVLANCHSHL